MTGRREVLQQQSPTFLAPGTGFMEDNFSTDWRLKGVTYERVQPRSFTCTIHRRVQPSMRIQGRQPLIWQEAELRQWGQQRGAAVKAAEASPAGLPCTCHTSLAVQPVPDRPQMLLYLSVAWGPLNPTILRASLVTTALFPLSGKSS